MDYRTLSAGQRSQIWLGGPGIDEPELVLDTGDVLLEAPNWSLDGESLFVNGNGRLWRFDFASTDKALVPIEFVDLPAINNDHVLDPDGLHIYLSAMDWHIYRGALSGGPVDRVSPEDGYLHFLHGVSPDGTRLAYVQIRGLAEAGKLTLLTPKGSPVVLDMGNGRPTAAGSTSTPRASPRCPGTRSSLASLTLAARSSGSSSATRSTGSRTSPRTRGWPPTSPFRQAQSAIRPISTWK
jgi:Tol biopolymer transport system component